MSLFVSIIAVVAVWWLSTGLVLLVSRRLCPSESAIRLLAVALAIGSVVAVFHSLGMASMSGTWLGFLGALGLWAAHEIAFLAGWISGPQRGPASPGRRPSLGEAFATVRDRQTALALTAAGLAAISIGIPNSMAVQTFLTLWLVRSLAEINLFLGAPSAAIGFLPERLHYIASYFRTDRISPAFTLTVTILVGLFVILVTRSFTISDEAALTTAEILAALVLLGVAEVFFLMFPYGEGRLWRWTD